MFKDHFTSFDTSNRDSKPSDTGASVKTKLTVHHGNQKKDISVFDVTRVGPALVSQRHSFGAHVFAVEATDKPKSKKRLPRLQDHIATRSAKIQRTRSVTTRTVSILRDCLRTRRSFFTISNRQVCCSDIPPDWGWRMDMLG
jgi:hypothetical protein